MILCCRCSFSTTWSDVKKLPLNPQIATCNTEMWQLVSSKYHNLVYCHVLEDVPIFDGKINSDNFQDLDRLCIIEEVLWINNKGNTLNGQSYNDKSLMHMGQSNIS